MNNYLPLGNSGQLVNGQIYDNSNQSCPRKIYARAVGFEEPIEDSSLVTFAVGNAVESVFFQKNPTWIASYRSPTPLAPFDMFPDFNIRLEADAVLMKDGKIDKITELKSISSSKMAKKVFAEGEYKLENLVQLASYMVYLDVEKGFLYYQSTIYHSFECAKTKYSIRAGDKKVFSVTINDHGYFMVDGNRTPVSVDSILRFGEYIACVLAGEVPFKQVLIPVSSSEPEKGNVGCYYCPCKPYCESCDTWDSWLSACRLNGVLVEKQPKSKLKGLISAIEGKYRNATNEEIEILMEKLL